MFHVVTGGSGSGKSAHGESLLAQADAKRKFYIATMEAFGPEAARRVERHRQMRAGKGFITIEQPRGLERLCLGEIGLEKDGLKKSGLGKSGLVKEKGSGGGAEGASVSHAKDEAAVLLECMSNLAANELFGTAAEERPEEKNCGEKSSAGEEGAAREDLESRAAAAFLRIQKGILRLRDQCSLLIVVTNEIFSDGISYEPDTEIYIRLLGKLNVWMAQEADQVTEVVCGIPLQLEQHGRHRPSGP